MKKEKFSIWIWLFGFGTFWLFLESILKLCLQEISTVGVALTLTQLFLRGCTVILLGRRNKYFRVFFFLEMALYATLALYSVSEVGYTYSVTLPVLTYVAWFLYFTLSQHIKSLVAPENESPATPLNMSESASPPTSNPLPALGISSPEPQENKTFVPATPEPIPPPPASHIPAAHGYCKLCGAPLDANKKCTNCGKQYFHVKKGPVFKFYAICITLAAIALFFQNSWNVQNTYDWINLYQEAQMKLDAAELRAEVLQKQSDQLTRQCSDLQISKHEIDTELKYYVSHAVFVTETGKRYHKRHCFHIAGRGAYIMHIETAQAYGLTACADCW